MLGREQSLQGAWHADQRVDPVSNDQLRDLLEVIVGWHTHRVMHNAHLFQNLGETQESAIQAAAIEQIHDSILCRVKARGAQPVGGGAHMAIEIAVSVGRQHGGAAAATRAEEQVCLRGWGQGEECGLVHDRCRGVMG